MKESNSSHTSDIEALPKKLCGQLEEDTSSTAVQCGGLKELKACVYHCIAWPLIESPLKKASGTIERGHQYSDSATEGTKRVENICGQSRQSVCAIPTDLKISRQNRIASKCSCWKAGSESLFRRGILSSFRSAVINAATLHLHSHVQEISATSQNSSHQKY